MENSIETIWKQGFLNEKSLVAPKINDLYNQKSIHVVDKIKRKMKFNRKLVLISAFSFLILWCIIGALWEGVAICLLFLFRVWYSKRVMDSIKILDQGATSYEYLKSFDKWLKDIFSRVETLGRLTNIIIVPLALSATWSVWSKFGVIKIWTHKYPNLDIPLIAIIVTIVLTIPVAFFSIRIYKLDVRLSYGSLFDKLEETIAEMEKLKQEE
jgi:hypothetical protein